MATKVPPLALDSSKDFSALVPAAFAAANAAYAQSNSTVTLVSEVFQKANTAADGGSNANAAFLQANTATTNAAGASLYANAAFLHANAAFIQANTGGADQFARDTANAASSYANSAYTQANTATTNAATADSKAVTAGSYANSAFTQANTGVTNAATADGKAVTSGTYANAAFLQANTAADIASSAGLYANAAFLAANNAVDTWVRDTANAASSYANSAYTQANTATTNAATADSKAVTAGSYANSAFLHANAAFTAANNAGGGGASASSISNGTSNVNIATSGGNVTTSVNGNANILTVTDTGANVNGALIITGQSNLGAVGNLKISGGTAGYVLQTDGASNLSWVSAAGGGGGVTSYALEANLPASATEGDLAYVTGTKKMYLWNGAVWILVFTATTPNLAPAITSGPASGYLLSTTGTPIVITMVAQDPENGPINWSSTITAGTLGNVATIAQSNNVFTITPSTNTAHGGSFELTITASDGVNLANARTFFRLYFTVSEPSYGVNFVSSLAAPANIFTNSTNAYFGTAIAAHGGTLAVLGKTVLNGAAHSDTLYHSVYIYTTLAGNDPVYQTKIDLPIDAGNIEQRKICLTSNMLIVSARPSDTALGSKWYVYFKNNDNTWSLTQTIEDNTALVQTTGAACMDISDTGLVFVCSNPGVSTFIYTRASTATTTWTLRQTIPIANVPSTVADNDIFPTHIKISGSGKHIALSSAAPDQISPVVNGTGKVVLYTNTTYSSGGYVWGATHTLGQLSTVSLYITVTASPMYDDIFYVFRETNTTVPTLYCIKYSSVNNNWTEYTYDTTQVTKFLTIRDAHTNSWITDLDPYLMTAIAGPNSSMSFLCIKCSPQNSAIAALVTFKFVLADLSTNSLNNKLFTSYSIASSAGSLVTAHHWNSAAGITNPNAGALACRPYVDNLTGEVFLAARNAGWGGITNSGIVHRYQLHSSTTNAVTKEYLGTTPGSYVLSVPDKCSFMSAVLVGGGGGGGWAGTSTTSAAGGGGGSLIAFSNYPVTPGASVSVTVGVGGAAGTSGAGITGSASQIEYNNGQAGWTAAGGARGLTGNSTAAGGQPSVPTLNPTPPFYSVVSGTGGTGGGGSLNPSNYGGGGGGAAGYGGSGGAGQSNASTINAGPGSGGGGAGGGAQAAGQTGRNGGGVGVYGVGASGGATLTGVGGSGSIDNGLPGSSYGYGGRGTGYTSTGGNSAGGDGAVRIIFSSSNIYSFTNSAATTTNLIRNPDYTGS